MDELIEQTSIYKEPYEDNHENSVEKGVFGSVQLTLENFCFWIAGVNVKIVI